MSGKVARTQITPVLLLYVWHFYPAVKTLYYGENKQNNQNINSMQGVLKNFLNTPVHCAVCIEKLLLR